jgi:hypothetical protein
MIKICMVNTKIYGKPWKNHIMFEVTARLQYNNDLNFYENHELVVLGNLKKLPPYIFRKSQ